MAKYAEVKEKQRNVDKVKEKDMEFGRGVWGGFTFGKNGPGVNSKGLGGMYGEEGEEGAWDLSSVLTYVRALGCAAWPLGVMWSARLSRKV